jgi:hypothetical protein
MLATHKRVFDTPACVVETPIRMLDTHMLATHTRVFDAPVWVVDTLIRMLDTPARILDTPRHECRTHPRCGCLGSKGKVIALSRWTHSGECWTHT